MKVTMYSNFMNHHQLPFSLEMVKLIGDGYRFVACIPIEQERLDMGYEDMNKKHSFIVCPYEDTEQQNIADKLAIESDIVILGSAPRRYLDMRLQCGKLSFIYSERVFKKGTYRRFIPVTYKKIYNSYLRYENENVYVLCSSAYASYDLSLCGFKPDKCYKWGYFPDVKYYDIDMLLKKKRPGSILWAGRLIDWKHPEAAVYAAKRLKEDGYRFRMNIIGNGSMESDLHQMIIKEKLQNEIALLGSMSPDKVRKYMEESEIFLFTSDFQEGWGAVLNEAMNSGCACEVSHAAGSAPFLVNDNSNGCIYKSGNFNDLYKNIRHLIDDAELRRTLGANAYRTMVNMWSPKTAAERLITLSEVLLAGKETVFDEGPCSRAWVMKNNWR